MPIDKSVPGITRCMKCQKLFKSKDKLRLRFCPTCRRKNQDVWEPRVYRADASSGSDDSDE